MNQLKTYRDLMDKKNKVAQLIEVYRRLRKRKLTIRYTVLEGLIEADIEKVKNELPMVIK